jgi:PII-like signaling protein
LAAMKLIGEQTLLRIGLRSTDSHNWQNAAESLGQRARAGGLAGATVLRGIYGLDIDGHILEPLPLAIVERVPVVVEIVDAPERIGPFLETAAEVVHEGLFTFERAHVLVYRRGANDAESGPSQMAVPPRIHPLSTLPDPERYPMMKLAEDGQLVRIFIGSADHCQGQPLYKAIVLRAREMGLAGATVLQGSMGFGAASRIHTARLLELSTDLPIVVELVDSVEKIQALLPFLDEVVQEGLITIEGVRVLKYRHNKPSANA